LFGLTIGARPELPSKDLCKLRLDLIDEEVDELRAALQMRSIVSVLDALADIVYVTYGAAIAFGLDLDAALAEVHRSNLTKLGSAGTVLRRPDGKVMKGPHYEPPDLQALVRPALSLVPPATD
jgi:predicted HAD superfamily Cof-like phosphohydrolase